MQIDFTQLIFVYTFGLAKVIPKRRSSRAGVPTRVMPNSLLRLKVKLTLRGNGMRPPMRPLLVAGGMLLLPLMLPHGVILLPPLMVLVGVMFPSLQTLVPGEKLQPSMPRTNPNESLDERKRKITPLP